MILKQNQAWICLENLVPDTSYELQVRARPQRGQHSVWSPWSETLIFRTLPDGEAGKGVGVGCEGLRRGEGMGIWESGKREGVGCKGLRKRVGMGRWGYEKGEGMGCEELRRE